MFNAVRNIKIGYTAWKANASVRRFFRTTFQKVKNVGVEVMNLQACELFWGYEQQVRNKGQEEVPQKMNDTPKNQN